MSDSKFTIIGPLLEITDTEEDTLAEFETDAEKFPDQAGKIYITGDWYDVEKASKLRDWLNRALPVPALPEFNSALADFRLQKLRRLQAELDAFKKMWGVTGITAEAAPADPADVYTRKIADRAKARTCTHCTCAFYDADGTENPGTVCTIHPNGCKHGKPWYVACMPCRNELWGKAS
jgi:hypothetical protein